MLDALAALWWSPDAVFYCYGTAIVGALTSASGLTVIYLKRR